MVDDDDDSSDSEEEVLEIRHSRQAISDTFSGGILHGGV